MAKENEPVTVTERIEQTPNGVRIIRTYIQDGQVVNVEVIEKSGGGGGDAGPGGGGGSSGTEEYEEKMGNEPQLNEEVKQKKLEEKEPKETADSKNFPKLSMPSNKVLELEFNTKIISDLLSNKQLLIDNNRDMGVLIIKLQCDPKLLSSEQKDELRKFIGQILQELDEFKKEKGISRDGVVVEKDDQGNVLSLRITIPTPKMYDAFIQRLAEKGLLPVQSIQQKGQPPTYQQGENHFKAFMDTRPTLPEGGDVSKEEEKGSSAKYRTPTPFSMDGPKPDGCES